MSVLNTPSSAVGGEVVTARTVVARRLLVATLAMILLGVAAGLVWVWLANPAQWEARDGGLVLTEAASKGQFSVIVVFVAVGVVTSVVAAWGITWALADLGWRLIPVVVVLTALAAVIAWRAGVELGPPSPGSVAGVAPGDRVPDELQIDSLAPFLAWPIFGLVGVIGATWARGRAHGDEV